jgi:tetratricopeptide (TPR) repeat protein
MDPDFPGAYFNLGLAHMNLGQFDRAISLFRKIQAKHSRDHRAKINEALCLRGIGDYGASIRLSLEIETKEKDELLVIVSNIAHCHVALGHRDQAIEWFDRLADVNPKAMDPPVYLSMLYMDQMDIEATVSQCSKILSLLGMEQNRTLNHLVELGEIYFNVGDRLSAMKKKDLARICFDISAALGYNN